MEKQCGKCDAFRCCFYRTKFYEITEYFIRSEELEYDKQRAIYQQREKFLAQFCKNYSKGE